MTDIERYRTLAHQYAETLATNPDVQAIWLFGSVQTGRIWAGSDIDLLVVNYEGGQSYALVEGVTFHLHCYAAHSFKKEISRAQGDPRLHGIVGSGELLYDGDGTHSAIAAELQAFPAKFRFYHLLPHLEAMGRWAQDLRKRMALGDERPRRAQHRQWELDNHAASILLIEKGIYPQAEPTTQALNARLFVPNLADPDEIEQFVLPRLENWLLPQLQRWAARDKFFDVPSLKGQHGIDAIPQLLTLAQRQGMVRQLKRDDIPNGIMYQLA